MASWDEFEAQAPDLAARARALLEAGKHKTLATLRRDGSPRISGSEADFFEGELWFGSMPGAVKARDLIRDGRFALHSASADPSAWAGDAKVAGVASEIADEEVKRAVRASGAGAGPGGEWHLFFADVREVVVVGLSKDRRKLAIESWHPDRGVERIER